MTCTTSSGLTFTGPFSNDHYITVEALDADNPNFFFNLSATANAGNSDRPNEVMNWGHNLGAGGGPIAPGLGMFGFGLEGHYEPSPGEKYFEAHLYMTQEGDSQQYRPWSWRIDKTVANTNGWINLLHFNSQIWFDGVATEPFAHWAQNNFRYLMHQTDGIPTEGFSFSAGEASGIKNIQLTRVGTVDQDFKFANWRSINTGLGLVFEADGRISFFSASAGQGGSLSYDSGHLRLASQGNIGLGKFNGADTLFLDNTNGRVGIHTATPAHRLDVNGGLAATYHKFPATQVPSADPNTLDDYEEAAYTPDFLFGNSATGMTFIGRPARYVKIGSQVTVTGYIHLNAKGSSVGQARLTLPFPVSGSCHFGTAVAVRQNGVGLTGAVFVNGAPNASHVIFEMQGPTGIVPLTDANAADGFNVLFAFTYFTN